MADNHQSDDPLVDGVYDIAVAPERLEQLVDSWMARMRGRAEQPAYAVLADTAIVQHVERAGRMLDRPGMDQSAARSGSEVWVNSSRAAAAIVDRQGAVVAANAAARLAFGIDAGSGIEQLPLEPLDLTRLQGQLKSAARPDFTHSELLRLRLAGSDTPVIVRLVRGAGGDAHHIGIVTSIVAWPARLSADLQSAFQLTESEAEVLKDLSLGLAVSDIANRSGRSEPTIRSHVRAILEKTGTRSQLELVRMTLSLFDAVDPSPVPTAETSGSGEANPEPNVYQGMRLADGRHLDYLVIGDPNGRSFLMLPTDLGLARLPALSEYWLSQNRMRMIVPMRAGYAHSSAIPKRRDALEVAAADILELCDFAGFGRFPILALCDDFHLAAKLALAAPDRVTAIIGMGPAMPPSEPEHFHRMPKWTRFIYVNARYAPRTLPFMGMAFFRYIRRLGPRKFFRAIFADSPADLAVLDKDEVATAMARGVEVALSPACKPAAWAAYAVSNYAVDWSDSLRACPVPMILFSGHQDPFSPFETVKDYASTIPNITLHDYPQYGQLLYPVLPDILAEVERRLAGSVQIITHPQAP